MNKPHVHAELIKAWADGAEIQALRSGKWVDLKDPCWYDSIEYRIKPPKKTPGQVFFEQVDSINDLGGGWKSVSDFYRKYYEAGANTVIEAYKQGMFDEDCNC